MRINPALEAVLIITMIRDLNTVIHNCSPEGIAKARKVMLEPDNDFGSEPGKHAVRILDAVADFQNSLEGVK